MRKCWQIKGCPASHYVHCPAYVKDVDCWEIKQGCLCTEFKDCSECLIYIAHIAEESQEETK
jgi:hypothetical protein